jgi:prevent-host-death family protein
MNKRVSAREANQSFSQMLGEAAAGATIVITRRGKPVAVMAPYRGEGADRLRQEAWDRVLARMEQGFDLGGERFDRDSLYDR